MSNFACSNLYQPQKLLSIHGLEAPHLSLGTGHRDDHLDEVESAIREAPGRAQDTGQPGARSLAQDVDGSTVFPALAFLGTALVVLFLLNQYYKGKSKPRRKRPRINKKFHTMYGYKVPSV